MKSSHFRQALFCMAVLFSFSALSQNILPQTKSYSSAVAARTISFDDNWLFKKDSLSNAEQAKFNDSKWRRLDLPHDWSIEDLPGQSDSVIGPFSSKSIGALQQVIPLAALVGTANILL